MPPAGEGTTAATTPSCSEVRKKARFNVYFDKVDIEKLVQTVSDATFEGRSRSSARTTGRWT